MVCVRDTPPLSLICGQELVKDGILVTVYSQFASENRSVSLLAVTEANKVEHEMILQSR